MNPVLKIVDIVKTYGGIQALKGVSISFNGGEVHAIVGENGAGKSTLIKTIAGAISPNSGEIWIDGNVHHKLSPKLSKELGIEVVYQEFNLIESLSVSENIFLGEKISKIIDYTELERRASELFKRFKVDINPKTIVEHLSPAQKQIVEILKALSRKSKVIIMDEPTAPLTKNEVDVLFEIIRELKNKGTTIIYISHRLDEIFEIADRVTVLRDGTYIDTKFVKDTNVKELIKKMVGREVIQKEDYPSYRQDEIVLSTRNLVGNGLSDINLDLYKGEILGLFGLVGSGRTELARLIFGVDKKTDGNLLINNELVVIKSTSDAMKKGIAMIPEDRKVDGCFIDKHISWNITISFLKNISQFNIVNKLKETEYYTSFVQKLSIKAASPNQLVGNLSGGNQQKVVIAKSLIRNSKVIIFDEPTRGIDVGARQEIYELIRELSKNGCSILAISSDMEELIHISNRIMVMSEGRLTGELQKSEFNRERILELASQIKGVM